MASARKKPFPLLTLDCRLRKRFLDKLDYLTIARLESTCASLKESCEHLCPLFEIDYLTAFPGKQDWILCKNTKKEREYRKVAILPTDEAVPCKVHAKKIHLNDILTKDRTKEYRKRFELYKLTGTLLEIYGDTTPENLIQIIEALKITEIEIGSRMTKREICNFEAFRSLSSIEMGETDLEEADILQLKAANLRIMGENVFGPAIIHDLIMQWKRGEREIQHILLLSLAISPLDYRKEILEDLDATILWVVLDQDDLLFRDDDAAAFTVERADNSAEPLTFILKHYSVEITTERVDEPTGAL